MSAIHIRLAVLVMVMPVAVSAATVRGVVRDLARRPLAGASVSVDRQPAVVTGADGAFSFDVPSEGTYLLRVSRQGFQAESLSVAAADAIDIELRPALAETIVVSGIRAEDRTPVTKTNLERREIETRYHGQDIPLMLRDTPSVNAYAEAGVGGSGYSYFSLRGVSPTRINFTLDAVPLADSEDMGTYFADFPDLAESLQSIQIQRGVGTSTVGSPSFGGSVNLQSIDLSADPMLHARVSAGSFGSRLASAALQSGTLSGGFTLYSRLSLAESDGFRDHSGVRQRNLFVSAARQSEDAQLKLSGFSARESQSLSFYAAEEAALQENVRVNPLAPEERDSFGYDLAQLQYIRAISARSNLTASAYYQRGYGWYRLFDDGARKEGLREYGLDGLLLGAMLTMSNTSGPWAANYGLHVNRFRREHTRDLVDGPRDYFNYGTKGEGNAFAKLSYTRGPWLLYSDLQLRRAEFAYHGDVRMEPAAWTFFNPKLGARYSLSPASSLYASAGTSTREPTRNDLFQGEDNPSVAHDLRAVRPERLVDFEAGWDLQRPSASLAATLYAMEFRNEIAATGELSEIGLTLRRNVGRSYRRGVEIDASWRPVRSLTFRSVANLSRNRIREWTQFYDVYDPSGAYVASRPLVHHNVDPLLTPRVIVSQSVAYDAVAFSLGAVARYTGRSYLDNTANDAFTTPSFAVVDLTASFDLSRWIAPGKPRVTFQVNNALDRQRVYPSGYSYRFLTRERTGAESPGGVSYYYPQAGRNVVVMLDARR